MPTRFPITASDIKVWGMVMNDALAPILANEHLYIVPNGNNPPTVKAGTSFLYHDTETYLSPLTPATGNNVYPVNTNITYLAPTSVNEPSDRTFAFGASGGLIADVTLSNSTIYYMYTTGAEDIDANSRGRGLYGLTTTAPAFDDVKKQWWIAGVGRALCRFYVDSGGNVLPGSLLHYTQDLVGELYTTTTSAPSITGLSILKDGGTWYAKMELNVNINNQVIYQYVNADTTLTNYYNGIGPSYTTGNYADAPTLYYAASAAINGRVSFDQKIQLNNNKSTVVSSYCAHKNGTNTGAVVIGFTIIGDDESATRTDITQLSWSVSGGAWVAGSDIRIYRGR